MNGMVSQPQSLSATLFGAAFLVLPIQQIVGDPLVRILGATDSETAAIQTCLDTAYTVPPRPALASGERMKLFDRWNES